MSDAATIAADAVRASLARIPYARFLGVTAELAGDEMTAVMPFADHLIGNPILPALHGGVIGAFMEITALTQIGISRPEVLARTVDIDIEYLRSGKPRTTYGRCHIRRMGRQIANVTVEAWQEARAQPIAALRGAFLLRPREPA